MSITLTREQATQLVNAQFALDDKEWEALAFTTACVPSSVPSDKLDSWRAQQRLELVSGALATRDALLTQFGIDPEEWANHWIQVRADMPVR